MTRASWLSKRLRDLLIRLSERLQRLHRHHKQAAEQVPPRSLAKFPLLGRRQFSIDGLDHLLHVACNLLNKRGIQVALSVSKNRHYQFRGAIGPAIRQVGI